MKKPQVNSTSRPVLMLREMPDSPPWEIKEKEFGELARLQLWQGLCPYCDTNEVEGFNFGGSDEREGGFLECQYCKVRISWIDNPYEASEQWYE